MDPTACTHEPEETVCCPACQTEQHWGDAYLGGLAHTYHYRCRYCGSQWQFNLFDEEKL